ncbi:MAG: hypothetical protein ACR2NR_15955 [Solirubrobacteraceae bacterium]
MTGNAQARVRARWLGLVVLAVVTLLIAAIAGHALGVVDHAPPLRRLDPPTQRIDVGALQGSVSIPPLCASHCSSSP